MFILVFFCSRTCIPAEAEPILNSSGCYPLVNFTRPFCQSHGITLPDYIYKTPHKQSYHNHEDNSAYDQLVRLGEPKTNRIFYVNNDTVIKCAYASVSFICHATFRRCDGTESEYKQQKICRETCLNLIRVCGWKIWDFVVRYTTKNHPEPEAEKFIRCEIQPYRNAGDSPECW